MTWQSVGTHTFVPTDKAVQVGSFDLAAGQDTIWVRITQLNSVDDWPWSYGILSWRNANGTPLGSIKAYSNRLGEVFRLGNGLPPSDGTGSIWFEPRGFNLGWLKAGFPWELQFEAQAGASDLTSGYWNRDPQSGVITPKTSGDNLDMTPGWIKAKNLILTDGTGAPVEKDVPGYQHGSWTPSLSRGTCGVLAPNTRWSRVGFSVTLYAELNSFTEITSSGAVTIESLPYPIAVEGCVGTAMWSYVGRASTSVYASSSGDHLRFYQTTANTAASWSALTHSNLAANSLVLFSATYLTDDTTWIPENNATVSQAVPIRANDTAI